jgi:hypothetical protein
MKQEPGLDANLNPASAGPEDGERLIAVVIPGVRGQPIIRVIALRLREQPTNVRTAA